MNPDECVAVGAAIQAGVLTGEVKDVLLLDVTPLSLGIETLGGVFTKLIERNTTIPTKKSQVFSTAADNQTAVDIHVLQGERSMASDNITMGKFQLDGIAPARRGVPQIEVTFDIDANGIVNVSAKDMGTGKTQHITITSTTNLNEEEIKKKIEEAEKYKKEDEDRKKKVDLKNESEALIYDIEKSMDDLKDQVSEGEKDTIKEKIEALKKAIDSNILENMESAKKDLTDAFQPLAQKVYEQAQAKAQAEAGAQAGASAGEAQATDKPDDVVDADYEVVD